MSRLNTRHLRTVQASKSYWPIGVSRLFASLHEIPWIGLTALGTLTGSALLFIYFRSLDHLPSELSSLVALGVTTSIVSLAMVLAFVLVLFSPTWVYQHLLSGSTALQKWSSGFRIFVDLAGLQFGGVGLLLAWNTVFPSSGCDVELTWFLAMFVALSIWGVFSLWRISALAIGLWQRLVNFGSGITIGFCGVLLFIALRPLQDALVSTTGDAAFFVLMGLWVLFVFANAVIAPKLGGRAAVVLAILVVVYCAVFLPLIGTRPLMFPTMVAQFLGVREASPQELRVPKRTCELVLSALGSADAAKNVNCADGEWGVLTAHVLSNVGDRWVLEIATQRQSALGSDSRVRLTVPSQDAQVVRSFTNESSPKAGTSCK